MTVWAPWLVVVLPLVAAAGVGFARGTLAGWGTVAASGCTLAIALSLPWHGVADGLLRVDALAAHLAILASGAGLLAAWLGRVQATGPRAAAALAVLAALELAALSNDMALTWVALEAVVLALGIWGGLLGGATAARDGAWRGLLSLLLALALALAGLLVLYGAARPVLGAGAMRWDALLGLGAGPSAMSAGQVSLSFILLLAGLATCAGLAPLHGWLHGVGRSNALLAGLLPAVSAVVLGVVLRVRGIVALHNEAVDPGPPLLALGLASMAYAAMALWRSFRMGGTAKPSAVGLGAVLFHAGMATVAFGIGGGAADAAGLVLVSSSVLLAPLLMSPLSPPGIAGGGWKRSLPLAALALLPPFVPFGAGIVLLAVAVDAVPWLVLPLAGLMVACSAGLLRAAVAAWRMPSARDIARAVAVAIVLALATGAGLLPQAARWFDMLAESLQ